jgi:hypothetical protein
MTSRVIYQNISRRWQKALGAMSRDAEGREGEINFQDFPVTEGKTLL